MQLDYTNTDPLKVPLSPSVWDYTCLSVTGRNSMQSALQLTPGTLQQPGLTFKGRTRDGINSIDSGVMGVVLEGYQSHPFKSNSISWIDFNGNVTEVIGNATSNIVVTLPSTSGRLLNDSYVPPAGVTGAPGPAGSINYNNAVYTTPGAYELFSLTLPSLDSRSYVSGLSVWFRAPSYNAGIIVKLKVNSQPEYPIFAPPTAHAIGYNNIQTNGIYICVLDLSGSGSWYLINPSFFLPQPPIFVPYEVPSGAFNGVNTTFTLVTHINRDDYYFNLQIFLNGSILRLGADYTVSGNTITMASPPPINVPGTTTGQQSYLIASYVFYNAPNAYL